MIQTGSMQQITKASLFFLVERKLQITNAMTDKKVKVKYFLLQMNEKCSL